MSWIKAGLVLALAGALVGLPSGCSDDGSLANAPGPDGGGSGGFGGVMTGPCTDGASRKCGIELAKHGDIVTCYEGTQSCEGGTWSECGDGSQITKSVSAPPGVGPGSGPLNALGNCVGNPCDPYCQNYNDDAGLSTDGGAPIYVWQGGQINGLPNGLVNKGLVQPCLSGSDCQFNTYCWHPKTTAGCAHSKCEVGAKLNWSCDPCVKEICKTTPSCCTYNHSCTHSPCSVGPKLAKGCDVAQEDCVQKICNKPGFGTCCSGGGNAWTAACVAQMPIVCGVSCPLNPAGTWTAACNAKVPTTCDATCGAGAPPPEEGKCKEWLPGETDPTCASADLAADVPCAGNIPVCNHGTVAVPAGVRIIHFPANSPGYPSCTPDQTQPQMRECFTTAPILPGYCTTALQYWDGSAWVAGCDQLVGNREVMVNPQVPSGKPTPPGYPGYVAECSCKDNWTLYSAGTCGPPVCGGDSQTATFKKVNYLVMMDRTQSMVNSGIWNPAAAGMGAFFQSPANAGLGVALEFFALKNIAPFGDGCVANGNTGTCLPIPCSNPYIPLGFLTNVTGAGDVQETKLVNALALAHPNATGGSGYGTRIYPALEGALMWATTQVTNNPSERYDVILLTDGDPDNCDTTVAGNSALAAAAFAAKGIKTHVIALPGSDTAFLNPIAAAGGTSTSIVCGNATMAADMLAALGAITAGGITCSSALPALSSFDPADVQVVFSPSSGPPVTLPKKTNLAACAGGGWYYDNNVTPTQVLLCPTSCTTAQNDAGSKIDLTLGCPKGAGPKTVLIPYQAQCPAGAKPTWNFFAYDTTTPNTSTVVFRARTAPTAAGLPTASWHNFATAQATPDTQVCALAGPLPCPVDAFAALGSPDQKYPWLELEITLTPGGGGNPVVNNYNMTYSCPPSE